MVPDVVVRGGLSDTPGVRSEPYVEYHRRTSNDRHVDGIGVMLSRYRAREPVYQESADSYRIGFTNHASFQQTLEYVEATGASFVRTDACRGVKGRAEELAGEIRKQLNVAALPSTTSTSYEWGG